MLAVEIHLLLELRAHLGLLEHDLLLDVLLGLHLQLRVHLLGDPIAFFLHSQCFVVLQPL